MTLGLVGRKWEQDLRTRTPFQDVWKSSGGWFFGTSAIFLSDLQFLGTFGRWNRRMPSALRNQRNRASSKVSRGEPARYSINQHQTSQFWGHICQQLRYWWPYWQAPAKYWWSSPALAISRKSWLTMEPRGKFADQVEVAKLVDSKCSKASLTPYLNLKPRRKWLSSRLCTPCRGHRFSTRVCLRQFWKWTTTPTTKCRNMLAPISRISWRTAWEYLWKWGLGFWPPLSKSICGSPRIHLWKWRYR